jgi:hypothetical protein
LITIAWYAGVPALVAVSGPSVDFLVLRIRAKRLGDAAVEAGIWLRHASGDRGRAVDVRRQQRLRVLVQDAEGHLIDVLQARYEVGSMVR